MKTFQVCRIIAIGVMLTGAVSVSAQAAEDPIIALINSMADRPENHQAIATYYETKAEEAREEAAMHEAMKKTYRHDHLQMKGQPASGMTDAHCDRLIELSLASAEEYEAFAALHAAEAK